VKPRNVSFQCTSQTWEAYNLRIQFTDGRKQVWWWLIINAWRFHWFYQR